MRAKTVTPQIKRCTYNISYHHATNGLESYPENWLYPMWKCHIMTYTSRFPLRPPTYIIKQAGANQIETRLPRHCSGPACSQPASWYRPTAYSPTIGADFPGAVGANAPIGKGSVGACTQRKNWWIYYLSAYIFFPFNPVRFLPARRYASAGLCDSNVSVRPSVCLSVRLSRAGIVSKRRKLDPSSFLHLLVAPQF